MDVRPDDKLPPEVVSENQRRLPQVEPEIVELMLIPYVGVEEARQIAAA